MADKILGAQKPVTGLSHFPSSRTHLLGTKFSHSRHKRNRAQMTTMYMNATENHNLHRILFQRLVPDMSVREFMGAKYAKPPMTATRCTIAAH